MPLAATLLVVEPHPVSRQAVTALLAGAGHAAVGVATPAEASEFLRDADVALVLADAAAPGLRGLLDEIGALPRETAPRVVLTNSADAPGEELAAAIDGWLAPGVAGPQLLASVRLQLAQRERVAALGASEARYRQVILGQGEGVVVVDDAGVIQLVNPAAEALLGRAAADLLGTVVEWPVADGVSEVVIPRPEAPIVLQVRVTPIRWSGREARIATFHDVSDRRRIEEALRASEARLRAVVESEPECVKLVSLDDRLLDINAAGLRMIEVEDESSITGQPVTRFVHPDDHAIYRATHRKACRGQNSQAQFRSVGLKGGVRWMETHATPLRDADGVIVSVLSVTRDITERKLAETRLARLTRLHQVLSRANEVMVRSTTEAGLYEAVCRVAVEQGQFRMAAVMLADPAERRARCAAHAGHEAGYFSEVAVVVSDDELGRGTIGTAFRTARPDICNDLAADPRMAPWRAPALARGYRATASFPLRTHGTTMGVLVLFAGEPDYFQADEVDLLAAVAEDLSFALESWLRDRQRRQAEAALQTSEARYREIVQHSPDLIVVQREGCITFVNAAGLRLLGGSSESQVVGRSIVDLFHPSSHDLVRARLERIGPAPGLVPPIEALMVALDGTPIEVEVTAVSFASGEHLDIQVMCRDVTERKAAEAKIRRLNRLYAVSSETNAAIVRTGDVQELYDRACRIAVEHGGLVMAWVGLAEPEGWLRPVARGGRDEGYLDGLRIETTADHPTGRGPAGQAYRAGAPRHLNDIADDGGAFSSREQALARGYRSCAAFPLMSEGRPFGVFVVYGDQAGYFDTEEIALLNALAGNLSHAVESLERRQQRERAEAALTETAGRLRERETLLASAQRIGRMGSWRFDMTTGRLEWSDVTCELFGLTPAEFSGTLEQFTAMIVPEDAERVAAAHASWAARGSTELEYRIRRPDGEVRWMYERGTAEHDDAGRAVRRLGMVMDVTDRKREERRQAWEAGVLESMSSGVALGAVLEQICLGLESMIDGALASILIVEPGTRRLRHGAAPNLPDGFIRAIDGVEAGEGQGSCGTVVHRREPVITADIEHDELWTSFLPLTRAHGLRACWSVPVMNTTGEVVATFGVYFHQPRAPQADELAALERTAHLVSIAVERERKDEAIRVSEERFRRSFQDAATGMSMTTIEGRFLEVNSAFCRMLGRTAEELRQTDFLSLTHPADRDANAALFAELLAGTRDSFALEKRYVRPDGAIVWVRVSTSAVRDVSGHPVRIVGVIQDVTAEHRARRQFEEFFDLSVELMAIGGLEGRFHRVNRAFTRVLGYETEALTSRPLLDFVHPDDRAAAVARLARLAEGERVEYFEFRGVAADGSVRLLAFSAAPVLEEGLFYAVARDITDQTAALQALRDSEERFRLLARATNDAIWDWDLVTDGIWWNDGVCTLFGYAREEIEPTIVSWTGRVHPEELDAVMGSLQRALDRGDAGWSGEYRFRRHDGTYAFVLDRGHIIRDADGRAVRMIGGMTDLSERKQLEQQYLRAQRLESIGTLAGGIAHDLNNVLAPILMSIGILQMDEQDAERLEILATIEQSAKRGAEMVRQVLSFARGMEGRHVEVQLHHLVRDLMRIAGDTFPKNITLDQQVGPDVWPLLADPTQIHQVLLNLCVNARDAMPGGGRITVRAANVVVDDHYAAMNIESHVGPYVKVEVEDTGSGMPAEVLDKIFDPFFTTKDLGKGTGLGLSTSLAIIKGHGGFIRVYSEVGRGTRFRLYLPAHLGTGAAAAAVEAEASLPRGRGETVLVVDDEAAVRQITRQTLESFGYRVLVAVDGSEAVSTYARHQAEVDVVLTDMMMPVMDGPATVRVLRRLNPAVRVIGASGIASTGGPVHAAGLEIRHFLSKPYTAETLLTTVRRALDDEVDGG